MVNLITRFKNFCKKNKNPFSAKYSKNINFKNLENLMEKVEKYNEISSTTHVWIEEEKKEVKRPKSNIIKANKRKRDRI